MLTEAHWQDEWELDKIKFVLINNTIFRNCLPTVLVFIPFNLVVHTKFEWSPGKRNLFGSGMQFGVSFVSEKQAINAFPGAFGMEA